MSDRRRDIDALRRQLAEADAQIVEMLRQRSRLARRAEELGGERPAGAAARDDQLDAVVSLASEELSASDIRAVFHEIHAATGERRARLTIAYVAPEGGACHVAAQQKFGPGVTFVACSGAASALEEVQRHRAELAFFPFETSRDGPLAEAVLALAASELALIGKTESAAQLNLMSATGELVGLERVHAYPADASACAAELRAFGGLTYVAAESPRQAAELARQDVRAAALVPELTGRHHELVTARANVRDAPHPSEHYALASVRPAVRTGSDATALLVGVQAHQPGALFAVLKHLDDRDVDVTCVHACPHWEDGWRYRFYVEVTGHVTDRPLITALEAVKREARMLRVLGSFTTQRSVAR